MITCHKYLFVRHTAEGMDIAKIYPPEWCGIIHIYWADHLRQIHPANVAIRAMEDARTLDAIHAAIDAARRVQANYERQRDEDAVAAACVYWINDAIDSAWRRWDGMFPGGNLA